ncbi:MAG: hypothetical protein Q9218_001922 [Villophora microphyllina]
MVSLVALIVWRVPLPVVILGFLIFGALDGVYLSSALTKVPDGAWFTLILAVLLSSIFVLWRFGKENQWQAEASDRLAPSSIIIRGPTDQKTTTKGTTSTGLRFTPAFGSALISTITGMGIFFDKSGLPNTTPTVFIHFIRKFEAAPRVVVFFHIRPLPSPTVPAEDRFEVTRCLGSRDRGLDHQFFAVTLRHGYTDEVLAQDLGFQIYEQLRKLVIREDLTPEKKTVAQRHVTFAAPEGRTSQAEATLDPSQEGSVAIDHAPEITIQSANNPTQQQESTHQALLALEAAYRDQVVYVVGKEQMRIQEVAGCKPRSWCRRIALAAFLWLRSNTGSKITNLNVDVDKLVEIGFVKVV